MRAEGKEVMANPHEVAVHFAERLRELRIQAEMTQAELAHRAGVTVETVARIERVLRGRASANANPSLDTTARIASALGVEIVDLLAPSSKKQRMVEGDRLAMLLRSATPTTRHLIVCVAETLVREEHRVQIPHGARRTSHR